MLSLSKRKRLLIDKRIIYTACGYMRQESQKVILSSIIPTSLVHIVLKFYFENVFDEGIMQRLKQIIPNINISPVALEQLNSFCLDAIDLLSAEASELASNSKITIPHLKTAVETIFGDHEMGDWASYAGDEYVHGFDRLNNPQPPVTIHEEAINENIKHILVVGLTGRREGFDVSCHNTVQFLKHKVYQQAGVPIDIQRLYFKGTELQDDRSLLSYGINDDKNIIFVFRNAELMSQRSRRKEYYAEWSDPSKLIFPYQRMGEYVSGRIPLNDNHMLIFLTAIVEVLMNKLLHAIKEEIYYSMAEIEPFHIQSVINNFVYDKKLFEFCVEHKFDLYCSWMEYGDDYYVRFGDDHYRLLDNLSLQSLCLDISNEETRLKDEKKIVIIDNDRSLNFSLFPDFQ
eukprot:453015_1